MLKKLIWFWNLIYYNLFLFENKVTNTFLYPFFSLFKSKKVREIYNKRGVNDPDLIVKDALVNPIYGSNSVKAAGIMGVIILFFCLGFFCLYTGFYQEKLNLTIINLLIFGVVAFLLNYYCLFKNKRYLEYFKEFNALSKVDRVKYAWVSFLFILFSLIFLISSFVYMDYLLHKK